jgi:hypothetical protein
MSQERTTNDIIESITGMLVTIAKNGSQKNKEDAIVIMEEGWKKMDEFNFNSELGKLWKQSHKEKKEIKP